MWRSNAEAGGPVAVCTAHKTDPAITVEPQIFNISFLQRLLGGARIQLVHHDTVWSVRHPLCVRDFTLVQIFEPFSLTNKPPASVSAKIDTFVVMPCALPQEQQGESDRGQRRR